jgi:hypothetical protein
MAALLTMIRGSDVTIVIPTIHGREDLLARALASVADQHTPPGDVIVQVDEAREGAAQTRNRALERVTTPWVAWLDDDDELLPNHVKVLTRSANRSGADMVFTYAEFVGGRDPLACADMLGALSAEPVNIPFEAPQEWWLRRVGNFIPVTYMVRTQLVRDVGGFPLPYSFDAPGGSNDCEDYGLLLNMLNAGGKFHHVCGVRTWRYHFHGANTGGRGTDRLHELENP